MIEEINLINGSVVREKGEIELEKCVKDAYRELHKTIDEMDRKVQLVIKKHESEFLYAYRSHIKKIKKELAEIKAKSEEQEKMFSANDRIRYLERQNILFREESLKLYAIIEEKKNKISDYKLKLAEVEKEVTKYEKQMKQMIKVKKELEGESVDKAESIVDLAKQIEQKQFQIHQLKTKLTQNQNLTQKIESPKISSSKIKKYHPNTSPFTANKMNDYQLKQWFVQCIRSVKKEISQRKNEFSELDLSQIKSIEEFRLVDKLRLFELFLQNEKMLTWMYQKVFPDRLTEINRYLFNSSKGQSEEPSTKELNKYTQELVLPRVSQRKSSIRNQVSLTNGRLNISFS